MSQRNMFKKYFHILEPSKMLTCPRKVSYVINTAATREIIYSPYRSKISNLFITFSSEGRSWLSKGMAYVEYETHDQVLEAIKMMDGGK